MTPLPDPTKLTWTIVDHDGEYREHVIIAGPFTIGVYDSDDDGSGPCVSWFIDPTNRDRWPNLDGAETIQSGNAETVDEAKAAAVAAVGALLSSLDATVRDLWVNASGGVS